MSTATIRNHADALKGRGGRGGGERETATAALQVSERAGAGVR